MDDLILAGDLNQDVNSSKVQQFFAEIGIEDVHSRINQIPRSEMDKTFMRGSKAINTLTVSEGLFKFIEGSKLQSHNKIIPSDYRFYIVDIDLEDYFNEEFSY